jgi:hypothetical protein
MAHHQRGARIGSRTVLASFRGSPSEGWTVTQHRRVVQHEREEREPSSARGPPAPVHDLTAAGIYGLIDALTGVKVMTLADKRSQGAPEDGQPAPREDPRPGVPWPSSRPGRS